MPAVKNNVFGRASGGELFALRKNLGINLEFELIGDTNIIKLEVNMNNLYILPIYLNCNHWQRDFDTLSELLNTLDSTNLILIGDFNS